MLWDLRAAFARIVHGTDTGGVPAHRSLPLKALRVLYAVSQDLAQGQLTLRAMSLVYTTLLSLVPLLAISFSVLKGFGVHNRIEPFLLNLLEPLGEKAQEITTRIIEFVDRIEIGVLGFMGLILLFYTVVSLLQKIERSLNFVWHITRERTLSQRFRDYLSVVVVGPVLVFTAMGIAGSVMSASFVQSVAGVGIVGEFLAVSGRVLPYVMVSGAFTFVYVFIPNTTVKLRYALIGGFASGLLWMLVGWGFASFVVTSAKYTAIYSTFATLIFFMIWLYLAWLILLVGGSIAFYCQQPEYIGLRRDTLRFGSNFMEKAALLVAAEAVRAFYAKRAPVTAEGLAQITRVPMPVIEQVLAALEDKALLLRAGETEIGYVPAGPPEDTPVKDVLDAVGEIDSGSHGTLKGMSADDAVDSLVDELDRATARVLDGVTLKDLAISEGDAAVPVGSVPLGAERR